MMLVKDGADLGRQIRFKINDLIYNSVIWFFRYLSGDDDGFYTSVHNMVLGAYFQLPVQNNSTRIPPFPMTHVQFGLIGQYGIGPDQNGLFLATPLMDELLGVWIADPIGFGMLTSFLLAWGYKAVCRFCPFQNYIGSFFGMGGQESFMVLHTCFFQDTQGDIA